MIEHKVGMSFIFSQITVYRVYLIRYHLVYLLNSNKVVQKIYSTYDHFALMLNIIPEMENGRQIKSSTYKIKTQLLSAI